MNLERRAAGVSLRLWALIVNLAANVLMVHGAVYYFSRGTHLGETIAGAAITAACIVVLANPDR